MLVLLDVHLLLHVILDSGCVLLAPLQLCHLLVLTSKLHRLSSLRSCGVVLSIPSGLLTLLYSLSLEGVSLLLLLKSLLLHGSKELSFVSDFVSDSSLFGLTSEKHCASVIRDLL